MISQVKTLKSRHCLGEFIGDICKAGEVFKDNLVVTCEYKPYEELLSMYGTREDGYIDTLCGTTDEMERNMLKGGICEVSIPKGIHEDFFDGEELVVRRVPNIDKDGFEDYYSYPATAFNIIGVAEEILESLRIKDAL